MIKKFIRPLNIATSIIYKIFYEFLCIDVCIVRVCLRVLRKIRSPVIMYKRAHFIDFVCLATSRHVCSRIFVSSAIRRLHYTFITIEKFADNCSGNKLRIIRLDRKFLRKFFQRYQRTTKFHK